jgi:hypothetical protein
MDHSDLTSYIRQEGCVLCMDFDQKIEQEYLKTLSKNEVFVKWYQILSNQLYYCNGCLPQSHKTKLEKVGCHEPSDHIFISVAWNSDKVLLTEDSDMGKGPKGKDLPHCHALQYLEQQLGLRVCDVNEAIALLRNSRLP